MSYERKPGDAVAFKNDYKKDDRHPDYKGNGLDLQGNEVDIAIWVKEGKSGKFFSIKISEKFVKDGGDSAPMPDSDDLPF